MNSLNVKTIDKIKWSHPSSVVLSGPSNSGKTTILGRIVEENKSLYDPSPEKIILFYREEQPVYKTWFDGGLIAEMSEGFPEREDFMIKIRDEKNRGGTLVIFDDLGLEIENNLDFMNELFTVTGHHYCVSIILVLHNLFSRSLRTLSLNCNRFILTKSLRDRSQVRCLASQSFPGKVPFIMAAYEDAISKKYGFLVLDFSPACETNMVVTSGWFGWDFAPYICSYLYKGVSKDKSRLMDASDCYTKQAVIPFSKYLKLVASRDEYSVSKCNNTASGGRSNSNISVSYTSPGRTYKSEPNLQETAPYYEDVSRVGGVLSEQIQGEVDLPPPVHSVFQGKPFEAGAPPPTSLPSTDSKPLPLLRSQPNIDTTSQDKSPHIPHLHPHPPLPPPPPPPLSSLSEQDYTAHSSAVALRAPPSTSDRRIQLHNELNRAIIERSNRSQPRLINRPPPKPLPTEQYDTRRALNQEIIDSANARSLMAENSYSAASQNMGGVPSNGVVLPLTNESSYTGHQPLQALENLQNYPPDSAYPIAIREQDADISAPLPYFPQDVAPPSNGSFGAIPKKGKVVQGGKKDPKKYGRKKASKLPSRHEMFTPSQPLAIQDFTDRKQSKSLQVHPAESKPLPSEEINPNSNRRGGKRAGVHLSKARPTFKAKRAKLGVGEKRKNDFKPPPPKRHMKFNKAPNTNFTLWDL
jgi:hypothetical protein